MKIPTLKEATAAMGKLSRKQREKLFIGLKGGKYSYGAWATQNKHCLKDWMEYCGVTKPEDIDYNEPHVFIENILNKPEYRHICTRGSIEDREAFLYSQFKTKEVLDMYFIGDGTGAYCEMERDGGKQSRERYENYLKYVTL